MRVLMQLRSDWEKIGGGDAEQVRETASALRSLGVKVDIEPSLAACYRNYDIVHLFNTTRINETWQQFRAARMSGCPVAVSPIWHSMAEMRRFYAFHHGLPWFPVWWYSGLREVFYARRAGFPLDLRSVFQYRNCQREVVNQANLLLPNSKAEYQILQAELATRGQLVRVINYGFNVALARQAANQCDKRRGIVCAGRVEPRKNSCGVIRAFRRLTDADQNLSFFGSLNEAHGKFCEEFRTLLEPGRIDYGGRIAINDIYRKFASAKVVVLASFYETCGMVALEALACGANVVVMDSAYTREYYQDAVFYCDPYDEASIAKAMLEALASPPRPAPNWLDNYTWERAGRLTLEAYKQVLERKHPPTH